MRRPRIRQGTAGYGPFAEGYDRLKSPGSGLAREFQPVEDPAEALRMLKEGANTVSSAMIWTAKQEQVFHSNLSMFSDVDKHLMVRVPNDFDVRAFEAALSKKGSPEVFFSVSLLSANIFFKTRYAGSDGAELAFELPTIVYKVQRRANLRFPIPEGHILQGTHADPQDPAMTLTRKILDISAGGLCFLMSSEEVETYPPGLLIRNFSFSLNQKRITVDGIIRHIGPLSEQKRKISPQRRDAWRVGVEFTGMRPADNHAIAAYVFEETRKFFTRFS